MTRTPGSWPPILLLALAAPLLGCAATDRGGRSPAVALDRSADEAPPQVMVLLRPAPEPLWVRRSAELAAAHGLDVRFAWRLASLDAPCVVYDLPAGIRVHDAVRRLAADPEVVAAQPVHRFRVLSSPYNDPYAPLQQALGELRLPEAHALATGAGVRVGIVDTGVDLDHPDLRGRVVAAANFAQRGVSGFTGDAHGTAVAGVIAAQANNRIGMVGTAPAAELVVAKGCWYESAATADAVCDSYTLAQALDYVLGQDVEVLNLSIGGPDDELLGRLLDRAVGDGIVVVAAVDESAADGGFPARLPGVLAVRSNGPVRRPQPPAAANAIAAPGLDVLTTSPRGGYDFVSGSSYAAAHVTGVAALLLERRPGMSPVEVAALLTTTARAASDGSPARQPDAAAALSQLPLERRAEDRQRLRP